jgi:aminoglycoside phosphotransferase (APT) family kinase protein
MMTDLQAPYRPEPDMVPQDWPRLAEYLAGHDMALDLTATPRQFSGGFANLNYRLLLDHAPVVLRQPPAGPMPAGANDMGREYRILSRMWRGFDLAPRGLHLCEDTDVLGAPFLIMEHRCGIVLGGTLPDAIAARPRVGEALAERLIAALTRLHDVDAASVDLDTLGRPEGFLGRQTTGWTRRGEAAWEEELPTSVARLVDWLAANAVTDGAPVLLHNDFKLDNLILNAETLDPVAVIDWDLGTRGDPLWDLAVLLSYWAEPGDPAAMLQLNQMPTSGHGFPNRAEVIQAYAIATGRRVGEIRYHRVLAIFRVAVVFRQLYRRWRIAGVGDAGFERFGELADGLLDFGLDVAEERVA